MKLYPYPFQEEGRDFLAERTRAYLADEMGLGKSAQAVLAARQIASENPLVICPASAQENWRREWELWGGPGDLDVWSYAKFAWHKPDLKPDLLIADEAHYCKSPGAARTRAVLGLASKTPVSWLLSGTPMPNHPGELWAPVKYLWPELAAEQGCTTALQWLERFCKVRRTVYGPKPYAVQNGAILRGLVESFLLRRKTHQVGLQLPDLRLHLHHMPREGSITKLLAEYEALEASEESYTSTLRRVLGQAKAPYVAELIGQELDQALYKQIVVLYYHRDVGETLRRLFEKAGKEVVGFGGGTPDRERQDAIDRFQAGKADIFLAQQTSAGVAITLTAASEIVLVEPAWSPDDNDQAIKRIHRIGQDQPCRARIFVLTGTLDESVMGALYQKMRMKKEVFGGREG